MKIKEINELDAKALAEKLENLVAQLKQLKLNHTVSPLENPSQIIIIWIHRGCDMKSHR